LHLALLFKPGIVGTDVPFHPDGTARPSRDEHKHRAGLCRRR
jgi:hypothetical protein